MDEILKSEIFIAVYERKHGVSFEEFGGVFRHVHGYNLNLSHYGYSSLRNLLNDMNDLVEIKFLKGQPMIRCKSPSKHHLVFSDGNNSFQANEKVSLLSSIHLPSVGLYQGPLVKKTEQTQPTHFQQNQVKVNSTSCAAGETSKETIRPKCPEPAKNINSAVKNMNSSQPIKCGFSLNKKTATINKTTKSHKLANPKPPISKPVHAKPVGNVATAADAARKNIASKTGQESNSKSSHAKSKTNLTSLQNKLTKTRSTENKVVSAKSVQNKKAGLLPTPKPILKFSPFDFKQKLPIAQPGILPNVSYASVCANNMSNSNFKHNGQQYTPNIRFNVNASGTRVNSKAEKRTPMQSISVIKENIQGLLTQHADGLSVFQLQKKYLYTFQQPLKFRGSSTLKQFLMELKDVVRTEGVGVQMLVFPVPAHKTVDADGEYDAALQVVLNPHSSDSLCSNSNELQKPAPAKAQLHLQEMDHMEKHTTKVVKRVNKQLTLQNMQIVEHIASSAHQVGTPREERSGIPPIARLLPNQINEKPQHTALQCVQLPNRMYKSHDQEEISYLCKNVIMKDAPSTNEPSQIAPQDLNFPRVILHSSGFSFLMGQPIEEPQNKMSGINLAEASSLTEQEIPHHSNNMLKGPGHSQQMLPITNLTIHDTKPHNLSKFHVNKTERALLQPYNSKNRMKIDMQIESSASQPMEDFQTTNNHNVTKFAPSCSTDGLQTRPAPTQKEKPFSVQENASQISMIKQAAYSSSDSRKKTSDSQIINKINIFLDASSNVTAPDAQTNIIIEKKLLPEASVSLLKRDLGKGNTHGLYVHGTKQGENVSSDVDKVVNIHTSKDRQSKPTFQTKQFDQCTTAERIAQTTCSPSSPRQDIVDPPQNIPNHPDSSVSQSEFQNNSEYLKEQEEMAKTWQTSQEHVCCIL